MTPSPKHLWTRVDVSVKVALRDSQGRTLWLRRSAQSRNHANLWDLPGGKWDAGEDALGALCREVAEETKLAIVVTGFRHSYFHAFNNRAILYVLFEAAIAKAATDEEVVLSHEHSEYQWCADEQAAQLEMPPGVRGLFVRP